MQKTLLLSLFVFLFSASHAQVRFSKLVGDKSSDYALGYGGYLKFAVPVSDNANAITLEFGVDYFKHKKYSSNDCAVMPLRLGYRYTLNQSGSGLYVEPQAGYNFLGVDQSGKNFKGVSLVAGGGYLFDLFGTEFDLSLRFSANFFSGGSLNYASIGISHNFGFGRRDD